MYVVAITELRTTVDAEAAALAAELGTTAYEERIVLNGGFPAVVLESAERDAAEQLAGRLRDRGHGALVCDTSDVVPSERMTLMRHFALQPDAIVLTDRGDRLPFADVSVLLRAVHRTHTETESEVKSRKFSMGRALLSGGLMVTKTVSSKQHGATNQHEQVLYVFRASAEPPWIVRERMANYGALGAELGPSSAQNFLTLIAKLRKLAPHAVYDDRLTAFRRVSTRVSRTVSGKSTADSVSSAGGVDLLAHVVALSLAARSPDR